MIINFILLKQKKIQLIIIKLQKYIKYERNLGFWLISFIAFISSPFITNDGLCLLMVTPVLDSFTISDHEIDNDINEKEKKNGLQKDVLNSVSGGDSEYDDENNDGNNHNTYINNSDYVNKYTDTNDYNNDKNDIVISFRNNGSRKDNNNHDIFEEEKLPSQNYKLPESLIFRNYLPAETDEKEDTENNEFELYEIYEEQNKNDMKNMKSLKNNCSYKKVKFLDEYCIIDKIQFENENENENENEKDNGNVINFLNYKIIGNNETDGDDNICQKNKIEHENEEKSIHENIDEIPSVIEYDTEDDSKSDSGIEIKNESEKKYEEGENSSENDIDSENSSDDNSDIENEVENNSDSDRLYFMLAIACSSNIGK